MPRGKREETAFGGESAALHARAGATLIWYRQDLRVGDHPGLTGACAAGGPIVPIYIWSPEEEDRWPPGAASRWWLHHSLAALEQELRARGSRLLLRRGPNLETLWQLAGEVGAVRLFYSRRYEPAGRAQEERLSTDPRFRRANITISGFSSSLLHEPDEITTRDRRPYQVFTPFWRACTSRPAPVDPLPAPRSLLAPPRWPDSAPLADLGLEPTVDWAGGLRAAWSPGAAGAEQVLRTFLRGGLTEYPSARDHPAQSGTSRLSPHLHFGELSPRQVHRAVRRRVEQSPSPRIGSAASDFLREIGWREFAYHLLWHFPQTPEDPLHTQYRRFPWRMDPRQLRAWHRGRTGYAFVDAGMRELWTTGWMHNRVRMVVASFLVKNLLLPWQQGARWFWDTLVDADLANNTLGWQWAAGCGADAAPYFRIFNPTTQGEKYDPEEVYIRRWIPELAACGPPGATRAQARGRARTPAPTLFGSAPYPAPIVDHAAARARALAALERIRRK